MKKKILCLILAVYLVVGLCACGGDTATGKEGLQAGFGRESVVPEQQGVQIAGGDASARLSDGYLDEVAITCIALTEGEQTILLYTMDVITVDKTFNEATQAAISNATGIPKENIILNATHTHSGVSIRSEWSGVDQYRSMFYKAAADAAVAAVADQSAADIYYGSTHTEDLVFVRHYLMEDGTTAGNGHGNFAGIIKEHLYPSDNEVQVVKLARAAEDKKDIVLMNFGAHATIVNGTNKNSVSADYPGAARAYVEAQTDTKVAFFVAAAGDQIPDSKISGMCPLGKKYQELGQAVGQYVVDLLPNLTKMEGEKMVLNTWVFTANSMKEGADDPDRVAQAKEITTLANQYGSSSNEVAAKVAAYDFANYYEASGIVSRSAAPATRSMDLHALAIGDLSFIFAPYEMFGVQGTYIKEHSPNAMTFVVSCSEASQGHQGYLPHRYACEEGFYEYQVTKYERGTAEKLAEEFVAKLTEMKNAG